MGLPKRLTEKQRKFAELVVYNEGRKTGRDCAVEAGYAEGSAMVEASRLQNPQKFPLVALYIGDLRQEIQKKYAVDYQRHITELARLRDEALKKNAFSAAINAEHMRGKAGGLYIEQKIIRTGKLEDLSEEQLDAELKRVLEEYSPILEGVEVKELKEKVNQARQKTKRKLLSLNQKKDNL